MKSKVILPLGIIAITFAVYIASLATNKEYYSKYDLVASQLNLPIEKGKIGVSTSDLEYARKLIRSETLNGPKSNWREHVEERVWFRRLDGCKDRRVVYICAKSERSQRRINVYVGSGGIPDILAVDEASFKKFAARANKQVLGAQFVGEMFLAAQLNGDRLDFDDCQIKVYKLKYEKRWDSYGIKYLEAAVPETLDKGYIIDFVQTTDADTVGFASSVVAFSHF